MLNPFNTDAFNTVSLTQAVNLLPVKFGRIAEMNLMPGKGVTTRNIVVEEKNHVLSLLPSQPVGAPGLANEMGKRVVRSFTIPHIPLDDIILPDEYQGVRAFGQENAEAGIAAVVNDHLAAMKRKHAVTLEYLRVGALKGVILDASGDTLYNLFTEFGITQATEDFSDTSVDYPAHCRSIVRSIEDEIGGDVMTGVHCLCGATFFDTFVANDDVKEAFLYHSEASQRLGEDNRKGFRFMGITFEEYRTTVDSTAFIAADEAYFFPVGTQTTFATLFAPADFVEAANTPGLEVYAKQEVRKFGRGVDLHTQSNPLPICYRPGVLVKGYFS